MSNEQLVAYLRRALKLQDPQVETDPAYTYTNEDLLDVLTMSAYEHNSNYTLETFPENEYPFLFLLAKKEMFYRLATATAPLYPLTAEGAELRKDYRFNHYLALIQAIDSAYSSRYSKFLSEQPVQQGELFISSKHFTERTYELLQDVKVDIKVINTYSDSLDVSWSKFNVLNGVFKDYKLYVGTSKLYDEFEGAISDSANLVLTTSDIRRVRAKIKGLQPDTKYYILIVSSDALNISGYAEVEATTKSLGGI